MYMYIFHFTANLVLAWPFATKVTVYLQGCLACKRCGECSLSGRYLSPRIKLKLIDLAIKLYQEF